MDLITEKALRLLQNIFSFEKINKKILPLEREFKPEEEYEYFEITNYFEFVNEENIQKLIELAIFMRRESEKNKSYNVAINNLVKYTTIGNYLNDTRASIDFDDALSKIIHANDILFEYKSKNGVITYGYIVDKNSKYTGCVLIEGVKKDGNKYKAIINVIKFCINVFMYTADRYTMQ